MGEVIVLNNEPFIAGNYKKPFDIDLLKVSLGPDWESKVYDYALDLRGPSRGVIRRIEIDSWKRSPCVIGKGCSDLTIGGGYVYSHDVKGSGNPNFGTHVDGFLIMGGNGVTIRNLTMFGPAINHACGFWTAGRGAPDAPVDDPALWTDIMLAPLEGEWPADIIFDGGCFAGGQGFDIKKSIRCGAMNCVIGRVADSGKIHIESPYAYSPVWENCRGKKFEITKEMEQEAAKYPATDLAMSYLDVVRDLAE